MKKRKLAIASAVATPLLLAAVVLSVIAHGPTGPGAGIAHANAGHYLSKFGEAHPGAEAPRGNDPDARGNPFGSPAAELYADLAYPATDVAIAQTNNARNTFKNITRGGDPNGGGTWQPVGPSTGNVSFAWTYTFSPSITSGRITALGIANSCVPGNCSLWVGAAGGGIWHTSDALANPPSWTAQDNGMDTGSIGSIWVDPSNSSHLLVGTGEASGSSDSEAGLGLYESTNGGNSWALVPGSAAVAAGRGIGGIAVDPANSNHIFIGTDVARHGISSVSGGRFTPPSAPQIGLYESTDGGAHFTLAYSKPSDTVNPGSPSGGDLFRGDVMQLQYAPNGTLYFSISDYGIYRSDGHGGYEQVYAALGGGAASQSGNAREPFALAPNGSALRIYVGDSVGSSAEFFRVDNANVAASTLTDGSTNPGWTRLDSSTNGTPGYAAHNFCQGQCWYDMYVASPAGHPDNVWLGGSMAYNDLAAFGNPHPRSNGRAVLRSQDAGGHWTDMTWDHQANPNGMHPDQHALVFDPNNPEIAFAGSDGGLVRTSGTYDDSTSDPSYGCAARGVTGANLADCQQWLSKIPTQIFNMNAGLADLQFQSVSVDPHNPLNNITGGTQDNGTWVSQGSPSNWLEAVGGDGGQSGYDAAHGNIILHSYYGASHDINFHGGDPLQWDWISDPLGYEAASFYVPIIMDPAKSGSIFEGEQHIWRTTDNGGDSAVLDAHCGEFNYDGTMVCGDWQPIGQDLSGTAFGTDKGGSAPSGNYVVAISRAQSNTGTMWAATRLGRVFVTTNADAADPNAVNFTRIDSASTPQRFVSGIAVDPSDPNHAFITFSGYDAYAQQAGTATGHVFDVHFNPQTGKATWQDISSGLGDVPVTGVAFDPHANDVYISTDFGVLHAIGGGHSHWLPVGTGLPAVTVYGLTLAQTGNTYVLYAATHGRSLWRITLSH